MPPLPLPRILPAVFVTGLVACRGGSAASPANPAAPAPAPRVSDDAPPRGDVPTTPPPPDVEAMLAKVDPQRLHAVVDSLAGFGTRHTLSSTEPDDRGIGAARRFLEAELRAIGSGGDARLQVELDVHRVEPDGRRIDRAVDVVNVVAVLPGSMPEAAHRRYYVIGHYDSRASDVMAPDADAPGANDDASGVAVVLELARVMAAHRYDATLVFMATAGEEQGLIGADRHARAAREADVDIRAVLNNDIVGDPSGPSGALHDAHVRVFSEDGIPADGDPQAIARVRALSAHGDSASRQIARHIDALAAWHGLSVRPQLIMRPDRFLRGGDHTAFNRAGYPAVRFTEVEENYDRQHQDPRHEDERRFGDVPEHVDATYLAGVARLNAAALAHLANAPSSPPNTRIVTAELTNDTTLRWEPSPEPDVAGYEVVWRRTTAAQWEHARDVGDRTESTLALSKDDWFFGVRAYDHDGYRSPASFANVAQQ